MKHYGYTPYGRGPSGRYQSLEDVETVRNRDDKSVLTIFSMHPERFLAEDVAHPDKVKQLTIILGFSEIDVNHPTDTYYKWYRKDTNTLCSDIIKFHNLETLTARDLFRILKLF